MSGAGRIKQDGSDDNAVYEVKDANLVYTLKSRELLNSFKDAARQSKDAVWVIQFGNGITMTGVVEWQP